jgi:hypothetical protein
MLTTEIVFYMRLITFRKNSSPPSSGQKCIIVCATVKMSPNVRNHAQVNTPSQLEGCKPHFGGSVVPVPDRLHTSQQSFLCINGAFACASH